MTAYRYTRTFTQFVGLTRPAPNGDALQSELRAAQSAGGITKALLGVTVLSGSESVFVDYAEELTTNGLAAFDEVIAAHTGVPLPSDTVSVNVANSPKVKPDIYPTGHSFYACGVGDDIEHGLIGGGTPLFVIAEEIGTTVVEWQHRDRHFMFGGGVHWHNANAGDHVTVEVYAPATPVAPNANNEGNCNLVDPGIGADVLIVPANGDGAYDVDLANASPVPAVNGTGYFDWDAPDIGFGTVSFSETPGASAWHLLTADFVLTRYINQVHIVGNGSDEFDVGSTEPAEMCPQWKYKATIYNSTEKTLQVTWHPWAARSRSV